MKSFLWSLVAVLACLRAAGADGFVSGKITGMVTDVSGRPLAGATVMVNRVTGARIDGRLGTATTDNEGRYEIEIRFAEGKTLVVREVFAEANGYVRAAPRANFPLMGGESHLFDFVMEKGEVLAGDLRLPVSELERLSGQTAEKIGRLLEVSGPAIDHVTLNARCYMTKPGGHFEFVVPPGEYTLRAIGYGRETPEWKGIKSGRRDIVLDVPEFKWTDEALGKIFDDFWEAMDRHYSYFFLKPEVDWNALKEEYRPKVMAARNASELATTLQGILAPLHDLHVRIESPAGTVPTYRSSWAYNGNIAATTNQLEDCERFGNYALVGRTKEGGFGCFVMLRQSEANPQVVGQAAEAIKKRHDTPGFIVDLRLANGGSEPLAMEIAKLFCAGETVYAKSKYRNGPGHTDFTREYERKLPAVPDPFTKPVVCIIGPGAVSSGEGFVKMMRCLPQVTTVGMPTRGASGNPMPWPLGGTGVSVIFSRWVDLMPNGKTFEGAGIPPDVEINEPRDAYATKDITFDKALALLRGKTGK